MTKWWTYMTGALADRRCDCRRLGARARRASTVSTRHWSSAPRGKPLRGRHRQARRLLHVPPFVRHAPVEGGVRHSHHPGVPGPQGRAHHDDLQHVLNRGGSGVRSPLDACDDRDIQSADMQGVAVPRGPPQLPNGGQACGRLRLPTRICRHKPDRDGVRQTAEVLLGRVVERQTTVESRSRPIAVLPLPSLWRRPPPQSGLA